MNPPKTKADKRNRLLEAYVGLGLLLWISGQKFVILIIITQEPRYNAVVQAQVALQRCKWNSSNSVVRYFQSRYVFLANVS